MTPSAAVARGDLHHEMLNGLIQRFRFVIFFSWAMSLAFAAGSIKQTNTQNLPDRNGEILKPHMMMPIEAEVGEPIREHL